jgi:PAS domain S-box-containing protein
MFVGVYDPGEQTLTYASCGHEPSLILSNGTIRALQTTGPPIGAAEAVPYGQLTAELLCDDILLLYTDGLSEAGPDRRSLLGTEGLTEILRRHGSQTDEVAAISSRIVADVLNYGNGELRDDACLIVARRTCEQLPQSPGDSLLARPVTTSRDQSHGRFRDGGSSAWQARIGEQPEAQQFRLLVESVTEYAIFMMDPHGIIASWNQGAQRIKGYTADEVIGKHFSLFYTPEDLARNHPANELSLATSEGVYEEEGWRVRKDGSRFWANVVITALKDDTGSLYGFAKVTRDITERKQAEEMRFRSMRDQISRSFLRDILFSVTEGRLRFCETEADLPKPLSTRSETVRFSRGGFAGVRDVIRSVATAINFPEKRVGDFITAASEAAMNAVVHANGGSFFVCTNGAMLQAWIKDEGSGIAITQLHRATLERGFTSENGLGHGFWLMLHTCDRLSLHTTASGTTVVMEQDFTEPEPEWLSLPRNLEDYVGLDEDAE